MRRNSSITLRSLHRLLLIQDAGSFWHRRRSPTTTSILLYPDIYPALKQAAFMKQGSAKRRCLKVRCMYSALLTVRMRWMRSYPMLITSFSTPYTSLKSSARPQRKQAGALASVSILNAQRRKVTIYTTLVLKEAALA